MLRFACSYFSTGQFVGTPQKEDYFLCAKTPDAARAWVSTLHATQLVLKPHKEAVNPLSRNGFATIVAATPGSF
ncbi:hypothetical protein RHMOL_Rhmol12G0014500 [Rhododendron molle]|uniref:Uncharacterized protein n=1 Tax=Rhododendron molle TaxID=49168 RepID=A0ACC0LD60_RHOML|nr:hypothetical protein RHMOL_Rhmol12G0014500 [Rhododendron molle]